MAFVGYGPSVFEATSRFTTARAEGHCSKRLASTKVNHSEAEIPPRLHFEENP